VAQEVAEGIAVVAKPPGTRTPASASWLIISPSEAFLPPTDSTSVMRRFSNGATYTLSPAAAGSGAFSTAVDRLVMMKHLFDDGNLSRPG
jgi:hypothetical protein